MWLQAAKPITRKEKENRPCGRLVKNGGGERICTAVRTYSHTRHYERSPCFHVTVFISQGQDLNTVSSQFDFPGCRERPSRGGPLYDARLQPADEAGGSVTAT